MKKIQELNELIEKMKNEGLDTTSLEILKEKELETVEKYCSISETMEILKKELPNQKFSLEKTRVLVREGKLQGELNSRKEGVRVLIESIYKYVEEEKMTKEDWKTRALELEQRLAELEKLLQTTQNETSASVETLSDVPEGQISLDDLEINEIIEKINVDKFGGPRSLTAFNKIFGGNKSLKNKFNKVPVGKKATRLKELLENEEYDKELAKKVLNELL